MLSHGVKENELASQHGHAEAERSDYTHNSCSRAVRPVHRKVLGLLSVDDECRLCKHVDHEVEPPNGAVEEHRTARAPDVLQLEQQRAQSDQYARDRDENFEDSSDEKHHDRKLGVATSIRLETR